MTKDDTTGARAEMPRYKCHKEVHALRIDKVELNANGTALLKVQEGFAPISVDAEYVKKHRPESGGYYIVYEDGYKSFSPREAFEKGYSAMSGGAGGSDDGNPNTPPKPAADKPTSSESAQAEPVKA